MSSFFHKRSPNQAPGFLSRFLALACCLALILPASLLTANTAWGQAVPRSLKDVRPIEPVGLFNYLNGNVNTDAGRTARAAAIALGKALLWDVQVGSDGQTACASCHFRAGTDHRITNTVHPGANRAFNVAFPNEDLLGTDFPFHDRLDPLFQSSPVIRNFDDAVGSQGIRLAQFNGLKDPPAADEKFTIIPDPVFNVGGVNVRQLTGRNTPTYINAAFTFTAFHDGRANNVFNGVNPFGPADPNAVIYIDNGAGGVTPEKVRIRHAALASQAVGPPLSTVEMSYVGRTFPHIGKKLLSLTPLGQQAVATTDSVFGPVNTFYPDPSNPAVNLPLGLGVSTGGNGLTTSYQALIQAAFKPRFWQSAATFNVVNGVVTPAAGGEFSLMEANFSLFFGLALQLYQMTLISDDSKFDQFLEGKPGVLLSAQEERGFELFAASGCEACHANPEFTAHASRLIQFISSPNQNPSLAIGVEAQLKFGQSFVDEGIYNVGVRPTGEDLGRGGTTPPGFDPRPARQRLNRDGSFPLSFTRLAVALRDGRLPDTADPFELADFVPPLPANTRNIKRTDMVQGAFKVPSLRNIELLGPFFHNGSVGTLSQVMDFYARGGNFPKTNAQNLHPAIIQLPLLQFGFDEIAPPLPPEAVHESIVSFLLTLTDERVRFERAPFDHPAIDIPAGVDPLTGDDLIPLEHQIPAVGAGGLDNPLVGFGIIDNPFGDLGFINQ